MTENILLTYLIDKTARTLAPKNCPRKEGSQIEVTATLSKTITLIECEGEQNNPVCNKCVIKKHYPN